jgi:hypothetical protein
MPRNNSEAIALSMCFSDAIGLELITPEVETVAAPDTENASHENADVLSEAFALEIEQTFKLATMSGSYLEDKCERFAATLNDDKVSCGQAPQVLGTVSSTVESVEAIKPKCRTGQIAARRRGSKYCV